MIEYDRIPKKKGYIYRGMSSQEFENAKRNKYFMSTGTLIGTYAAGEPETAEGYAEYFVPSKSRLSMIGKPTYVVAFKEKDLNVFSGKDIDSFVRYCKKYGWRKKKYTDLQWRMLFKEKVPGDSYLIMGKVPFSKAKEVYKFVMGKWVKIK